MKRTGRLLEKIASLDNIRLAIKKVSERKRGRKEVQRILGSIDTYAKKIRELLLTESFRNGHYGEMIIHERTSGKTRLIQKPPIYPDQIIHWAVMLQISPIIMKGLDPYSCGSIPKRGERFVRETLKAKLKKAKGPIAFLKYDIHHYYQSIDHQRLLKKLQRRIKDPKALSLLKEIIGAAKEGLPIGAYASQWLANFYLEDLDRYTRQTLKVKAMWRYVDDVVILGDSKEELRKKQKLIEAFLNQEGLETKPNWIIAELDKTNIDFVGYRFHKNGKLSIRKRVWRNARRKLLRVIIHGANPKRARSVMAYNSYIRNADSYFILNNYYPRLKFNGLRSLIAQGG